jgi:hypothetical protein
MGMISAELVAGTDKRDSRGRRLAGEERRLAVLTAYDRTSLTQRAFAEQEGVRYHTLVTWLVRRRREQVAKVPTPETVRFAEVRVPKARVGIEIALPSGIVIRGTDAAVLAALIKALQS